MDKITKIKTSIHKKFIIPSNFQTITLKGMNNKKETDWLQLPCFKKESDFLGFFNNFDKDNIYVLDLKSLHAFLEDGKNEFNHQKITYKGKKGYKTDISNHHGTFQQRVRGNCDEKLGALEFDCKLMRIKQRGFNKDYHLSAWNILKYITLPLVTELKIETKKLHYKTQYKFIIKLNKKLLRELSKDVTDDSESERISQKYKNNKILKKKLLDARLGQGFFRREVLSRRKSCLITGVKTTKFLEACHIKPWRYSNDNEKIDYKNGIPLTPNAHKLFDKGLIFISEGGKIEISSKLNKNIKDKMLGIIIEKVSKKVYRESTRFFKWHREKFRDING